MINKINGCKLWTCGDLGHSDKGVPGSYKFLLEPIAMLWHSLNQCWLIISEVKWLLLFVWSFIQMWWIKSVKKVKLDFIFPIIDTVLDVRINQSLNFDWFTSQKGISDRKIKFNLTFTKYQVHLVQIRCTVNMTKLSRCAFGAHNFV